MGGSAAIFAAPERPAPGIAGIKCVPELNSGLTSFPAEPNLVPFDEAQEIHEPGLHILDDSTPLADQINVLLDRLQQELQLRTDAGRFRNLRG